MAFALPMLISYLSGSLPWGLWLGWWFKGVDVRTLGSRNLGATNVYRSLGPAIGAATLVLDIAKGAIPTWLVPLQYGAEFPGGFEWCRLAVGFAAVLGHVFTLFAGFKGGKGVATTVGVLLALNPPAFAAFMGVFLLCLALTRFVSLGSILGSLAFAVTLGFAAPGGWRSPTFGFGVLIAILVIVRHHENIRRLLQGTERRFTFRKEEASS
ncbi:MAG: glycerol-3-phosphate 1-O-acyltransferase PlsY [Candidatus Eisenbacteria bacterium]